MNSINSKEEAYLKLKGYSIKPKELPKDNIDSYYKTKILSKKTYCLKPIIRDLIVSSLVLVFLSYLAFILISADSVNTNLTCALLGGVLFSIAVVFFGGRLISIPKRLSNYNNFDFERTCYATVSGKYKRTVSTQHGNSRITKSVSYYVNAQINDEEYIKGINVSYHKYFSLNEGDRVIVVSYDGYTAYIIKVDDNSNKQSFSRDSFNQDNFSRDNLTKGEFYIEQFNLEDFDIEKFKRENL